MLYLCIPTATRLVSYGADDVDEDDRSESEEGSEQMEGNNVQVNVVILYSLYNQELNESFLHRP